LVRSNHFEARRQRYVDLRGFRRVTVSVQPLGHGSVENPMLVDGRGKSVRVAWSNNAADKRAVDDLIAYLLSL
jgi:hypothetical protein